MLPLPNRESTRRSSSGPGIDALWPRFRFEKQSYNGASSVQKKFDPICDPESMNV